jgi:hypothetical protein
MSRAEAGVMMRSVLALPVSVEQVATVIKQMGPSDRQRLLDLVPELRQAAVQAQPRTLDEARVAVERVRTEVMQALGGQVLSSSEPFLGDMTLGQYLALPDEERARLWDQWGEVDLGKLEELDVRPDAVLAG